MTTPAGVDAGMSDRQLLVAIIDRLDNLETHMSRLDDVTTALSTEIGRVADIFTSEVAALRSKLADTEVDVEENVARLEEGVSALQAIASNPEGPADNGGTDTPAEPTDEPAPVGPEV